MKEIAMFERLRTRFADWQAYRTTVYQLGLLDRHALLDAGVNPDAIKARAKAAVRTRR
jgi:uncharacterized protein YjiS (DUF1127 family)